MASVCIAMVGSSIVSQLASRLFVALFLTGTDLKNYFDDDFNAVLFMIQVLSADG